jgi:hypothetical protein
VNLTGDILRVYQGFGGVGPGRGIRIWRLGRVRGNYYCCVCFRDVWKLEYELVHCVKFSDRPRTGMSVSSNLREFNAEIQVLGTGSLINAGGPF